MTVRELRQMLALFEGDLQVVVYSGAASHYVDPGAYLIQVVDCPQAGAYRQDRENVDARYVLALDTR